jgi:DNA-binding FrmR family transcriptional regulator
LLDKYTPPGYMSTMHTTDKSARLKRLNRIEGQVRGLARMVDEDRYCIDIVTQISAVRAALRRVEEQVLQEHIGHCVEKAITSGRPGEQRKVIEELMELLGRASR